MKSEVQRFIDRRETYVDPFQQQPCLITVTAMAEDRWHSIRFEEQVWLDKTAEQQESVWLQVEKLVLSASKKSAT